MLLVDISRMEQGPLNEFKGQMFREFGIRSNLYENLWEYEQYVRLALPAIAVLKAIGAAERDASTVIVAHEFMGMPTALAAILDLYDFKTVFYAHEVAPMRSIVEKHPGHDTMFFFASPRYQSQLLNRPRPPAPGSFGGKIRNTKLENRNKFAAFLPQRGGNIF